MPIYEYECTKCGAMEEIFQKLSEKPRLKCKHCSGKLHKLISQSSFHLKGTGWYVTDYANKPSSSSSKSSKSKENTSKEKKILPNLQLIILVNLIRNRHHLRGHTDDADRPPAQIVNGRKGFG